MRGDNPTRQAYEKALHERSLNPSADTDNALSQVRDLLNGEIRKTLDEVNEMLKRMQISAAAV